MKLPLALCLLFGLSALALRSQAQQNSGDSRNTPLVSADPSSPNQSGSALGVVVDESGGAVSGAEVTLSALIDWFKSRSVVTAENGGFIFDDLSAGTYTLAVKARGFQSVRLATITLKANQKYEIPRITLTIAPTTTEVVVRPTEVIAAREVKAEERQRVFGLVPDFYTSYIWNAAPLDASQKFSLAVRGTFDPFTFVGVSIGAGIEQAKNAFPGYGQGSEGYGKRWGALFANGRISDILSKAVFPTLFHQDPRYFYQGSGGRWSRAKHAVSYSFVARNDDGRRMPNYAYFLGDICAGALSNLYYPASNRGATLVFTNAAIGFAGRSAQGLVREFVLRHITMHVAGAGTPLVPSTNP